jgi:anaerobic selenocysteine-containing dehydrogenase
MAADQARSVCPLDCPDTCSMVVGVENERAVSIRGNREHSYTRGFLCHKVSKYLDVVYHQDRLKYPLRRVGPKGAGEFERISWDAALDEIASRFRQIAAGPHGPQAILPYSYCGTMGKIQSQGMDRRFFNRLGASLLDRTICATAGALGYSCTIGHRMGMQPEAFAESRYIINWGSNTAVTNSHLWSLMVQARKNGAKIVSIDPYRCQTAARSDWHLAPRVGTDAALALGMMHVIFRDKLQDQDYLDRFCLGGEALRERVEQDYGLDRVSQITGLPARDVERLAHEYVQAEPASIRVNYGMQRHQGGGMAVRTIACLPAIIGAWRFWAGGILLSTSGHYQLNSAGLERPDLVPRGTRTINMVQLAEALEGKLPGPPVQALYVYNSNPAAVAPDQKRVLKGLQRDDLFTVVHDLFQTDTADYADLVLPATSQLEHFDLHTSYGHHWVQANQPVIPPYEESRCNSQVFRELSRRLDFEPALFEMSDEQLARIALWEEDLERKPKELDGITVDVLKQDGPQRLRLPERYIPFAEGNFPTPSGKCQLDCPQMAHAGLDRLPSWTPPAECEESAPELFSAYPLQLLSPPSPHFLNSTFVAVEALRKSAGEPELEIHPADASVREIQQGEPLVIFNGRGAFQAKAKITDAVRPGVVVAPSIWWNKYSPSGTNANSTTSTTLSDMGGGATFFDNLVEVKRVSQM